MVFFNYSTMQMAAKIVFYGPGLCGKTTNLQYIYSHTSNDSRGEMVSLETETDRTLFFDLLPIDVGKIGGFNTRIQLYTVPGQVFYNTTRKLVLKGVDGIVFVADSQRPMLDANVESFRNLGENLAELGLSVDDVPLVLQYNKRDLQDILTVEELNASLNEAGRPFFEASALTGTGVFETLKGISKATLLHLKKKLSKEEVAASPQKAAAPPSRPGAAEPPASPPPATAPPLRAPGPSAAQALPAAPGPAQRPAPARPPRPAARSGNAKGDVLAELEKIRRQTLVTSRPPGTSPNGRQEITREIQLTLDRSQLERAERFLLSLKLEDGDQHTVDALRDFQVDLGDTDRHQRLLLRFSIAVRPQE